MRISPRITPQMTRLTRPDTANTRAAPTSPVLAVPCCWFMVTIDRSTSATGSSPPLVCVTAVQPLSEATSNFLTMLLILLLNRFWLTFTLPPVMSATV